MQLTVNQIATCLETIAPLALSESWDNTGLLLGDPGLPVSRVMGCLTITDETVSEAIAGGAELIVAHHPLPFKPILRMTTQSTMGGLLWRLARAGICLYSPHTAWDSALGGINDQLAERLGLTHVQPIVPAMGGRPTLGAGRHGEMPNVQASVAFSAMLVDLVPDVRLRGVDVGQPISRVGIACGSGGSLLEAAAQCGCDAFITGEATYHTCLEAQARKISLFMLGHFASERFSIELLIERLRATFPELSAWPSKSEQDPVRNLG